jgi:hypothetical protein
VAVVALVISILSAATALVALIRGIRSDRAARHARLVLSDLEEPESRGRVSSAGDTVKHVLVNQKLLVQNVGRSAATDVEVRLIAVEGEEEQLKRLPPLLPGEANTISFTRRAVAWQQPARFAIAWHDEAGAHTSDKGVAFSWTGIQTEKIERYD